MRVLGLWNVSKQAQFAFKPTLISKHLNHTKAFVTTPIYYVNAGKKLSFLFHIASMTLI